VASNARQVRSAHMGSALRNVQRVFALCVAMLLPRVASASGFLQEAMRQRMRLCLRLVRPDEAASVARQYLARFPAGPYTNLARRLVISQAARRGLEAY